MDFFAMRALVRHGAFVRFVDDLAFVVVNARAGMIALVPTHMVQDGVYTGPTHQAGIGLACNRVLDGDCDPGACPYAARLGCSTK